MNSSRRVFMKSSGLFLASTAALGHVITATSPASAHGWKKKGRVPGYGALVRDPAGLLDLPAGFRYRAFSRAGDPMGDSGTVPGNHDGMAAFGAGRRGVRLVRNHEIDLDDVNEDGLAPVPHVAGATYDPDGVGGTTTLLVSADRRLLEQRVSLAGTVNNCAGGPTPWGTWLSCEETDVILSQRHGYVFEVDPVRGGDARPITAMGRFEHEAVAFDRAGRAYLTEDAGAPFGCFYRFEPKAPLAGRGSLHAGGRLSAMAVLGVNGDLSSVLEAGRVLQVRWVDVPSRDPGPGEASVREQVIALGATPVPKAEGVWTGVDGSIWFVSSRGDGPNAEDAEDASAGLHSGQIWRYDPRAHSIELVALFAAGSPFDGPDNITASPYGFALACTDGEDDQWLVGIDDEGRTFPFALNALDDSEFAGATFSPDGQTLFVNIQGEPAVTLAIWGPWLGMPV